MLSATRTVVTGEMASVSYGDDYWSSGVCLCNSENCISRR